MPLSHSNCDPRSPNPCCRTQHKKGHLDKDIPFQTRHLIVTEGCAWQVCSVLHLHPGQHSQTSWSLHQVQRQQLFLPVSQLLDIWFWWHNTFSAWILTKTTSHPSQALTPQAVGTGWGIAGCSGLPPFCSEIGVVGKISSLGSTMLTWSGRGFLGPIFPLGSQGNIIFTLIPSTPAKSDRTTQAC